MIGFLVPWMLGAAVISGVAVGVLHLLSVHRPPEMFLPTARFLPERQVRAVSRTKRPTDILLLMLRVAVLMFAGVAAARPYWQSTGANKVVLAVIDAGIVVDTVGDTTFMRRAVNTDRIVTAYVSDRRPGDLHDGAAVWPVAWRAASRLLSTLSPADSLELHLFVRDSGPVQAPGWNAWRATWPGVVVIHSLPAVALETASPRRVVVVQGDTARNTSGGDDVVRAALAWHAARLNGAIRAANGTADRTADRTDGDNPTGRSSVAATVHTDTMVVYRNNGYVATESPDTSATVAYRVSGRVRLYWPRDGIPRGFAALSTADSGMLKATSVVAAGRAVVAPFTVAAQPVRVAGELYHDFVWFGDGRVAALEHRPPNECIRSVAVTVAPTSDLLFGPSANGIFDRLLASCASQTSVALHQLTQADTQTVAVVAEISDERNGSTREYPVVRDFARQSGIPLTTRSRDFLLPVLLTLALLLLIVEGRARVRTGDQS